MNGAEINQTGSIQEVFPGVYRWEHFSPAHKVDLTSHAVVISGRLYVFDPISLGAQAMEGMLAKGTPTAIVLTSENHWRAAAEWQLRLGVPIWVSPEADVGLQSVFRFDLSMPQWLDWELFPLTGGAGGEMAFRLQDQSLVIVGDAIVNLPDRGLEVLPEKYCRNQSELRNRIRSLAARPFERLLMAHGTPLVSGASESLLGLLL